MELMDSLSGDEGFEGGELEAEGFEVEPEADFGVGGGEVDAGGGAEAPFAGGVLVEVEAEAFVEPGAMSVASLSGL